MSRCGAGSLVVLTAGLACAQPSSPPGGQQDRVPPRVVAVSPEALSTLRNLRSPVRIEFDERLSIRLEGVSDLADAVLVSPATGEVRVERGRRSLEISLAGGWRPDVVYRVVVLPVFRDLFGNRRIEPIELVFTTGAPIPPTAVAGFVEDPLTGTPVGGARIEALLRPDSLAYVAVSDTSGFFSLRNIPPGAYDLRGWLDADRDREPDFREKQDTADLALGQQDTVVLALGLLEMDTVPARLLRAEPVDSLRIRLHFDDYVPPGPVPGRAVLLALPDSSLFAEGSLLHSTALDSILARERAAADSLRVAEDSVPPAPAPRARGGGGARRPLPSQELIMVLPLPMRPGATYVADVAGVTNIRGVPGGGGTAAVVAPTRPDTAAAVPDDAVPPAAAPPPDTVGP